MATTFNVAGMHCDGCERNISEVVLRIPGVSSVRADHEQGTVLVEGDPIDRDAVTAAIEDAGYDVLPDQAERLPLA